MAQARLMVVEDEGIVRKDLAERLQALGYSVVASVAGAQEAVAKAAEVGPDLVLMDIMLEGGMDGIQAAEQINRQMNIPVMYLTAFADNETLQRAKRTGPYGYILKPFEERELLTGIETALYKHQMENRLRESEEKYRTLVESSDQLISIVDKQGVFLFLNACVAQWLGGQPAELIGKSIYELFPPSTAEFQMTYVTRVIDSGEGTVFEAECELNKQKRWHITRVQPLKYHNRQIIVALMMSTDITERKLAEQALEEAYHTLKDTQQQLIHSSKMNAMGQLAAGISHELNQPLTGIRGFAQVALLDLEPDHKINEDLRRIVEQTERMEKIIQNVRSFARKTEFKIDNVDLNKAIEDSLALLKTQLKVHNIRLQVELDPALPRIRGDLGQLQQVFINLITNARDAIDSLKRPEGGQISLKTAAGEDGKTALAWISDDGCGISQEHLESIFNPFFTTKSPNGGLGLGLSIVYRIIDDHNGSISVQSAPSKGTSFRLSFNSTDVS